MKKNIFAYTWQTNRGGILTMVVLIIIGIKLHMEETEWGKNLPFIIAGAIFVALIGDYLVYRKRQ
jgi:hypothetical protein